MIYRPQFAYVTPPGCRDVDFIYYFDGSNTPALNQNFATGLDYSAPTGGIPLTLEQDVPFFWRGLKVSLRATLTNGDPDAYGEPNFTMRLMDNYFNFLSDDMVPAEQYGFPMNPLVFNGQLLTGNPVPLEPEIYCPPGGVLWLFLKFPVTADIDYFPELALYGVKRFKECVQ